MSEQPYVSLTPDTDMVDTARELIFQDEMRKALGLPKNGGFLIFPTVAEPQDRV